MSHSGWMGLVSEHSDNGMGKQWSLRFHQSKLIRVISPSVFSNNVHFGAIQNDEVALQPVEDVCVGTTLHDVHTASCLLISRVAHCLFLAASIGWTDPVFNPLRRVFLFLQGMLLTKSPWVELGCQRPVSLMARLSRYALSDNLGMSSETSATKIDETGLRFKKKASGSPFDSGLAMKTMSCFLCGKHKPRDYGKFREVAGKKVLFCFDCKPPAVA